MDFLDLPKRTSKPRETGITHVIDKGMGVRAARDMLETAHEYIDIVKLGWGTGYVTQDIDLKLRLYREYKIPVCFGGTLTEVAIAQNKLLDLTCELFSRAIFHIEISTGVLNICAATKAHFIRSMVSDSFTVLSEVGKKSGWQSVFEWLPEIRSDLNAGAWKVILEGRESGTVGIYDSDGVPREPLIESVCDLLHPNDLIFEAPKKSQQVWFIKRFGPNVNLGNIAPDDVIPLETLRLGLRGDTFGLF